MLDLSQPDLAALCGLTKDAINQIERGVVDPKPSSLTAIRKALENRGIEFIPQSGIRLRDDTFRIIDTGEPYLQLLDDVFMTLHGSGNEALFLFVDNEKSPQAVIDNEVRMRRDGIKFRFIINYEKPYCLFPLREYRGIPPDDFHNNPIIIYADKVALVIDTNKAVQITKNASAANAMKHIFECLWRIGKMPVESTAKVTYD